MKKPRKFKNKLGKVYVDPDQQPLSPDWIIPEPANLRLRAIREVFQREKKNVYNDWYHGINNHGFKSRRPNFGPSI